MRTFSHGHNNHVFGEGERDYGTDQVYHVDYDLLCLFCYTFHLLRVGCLPQSDHHAGIVSPHDLYGYSVIPPHGRGELLATLAFTVAQSLAAESRADADCFGQWDFVHVGH